MFQLFEPETNGFVTAQPASKQQRKKGTISLALEFAAVRGSTERDALLNSQPVSEAHAQSPDPFDQTNP